MLDNLVRLQYIADPNPGEHRSKQLCTLPITLQGFPVDSKLTEEWHLPECDGSFNCICKHPITLPDDDVFETLVELTENEKDVRMNFFNWMTLGNSVIWKQLPDDLLEQIEENQIDELQDSSLQETNDTIADDLLSDEEGDQQNDENLSDSEVDQDLVAILGSIQCEPDDNTVDQYVGDDIEDEMSYFTVLEKSMEDMSILDQDIQDDSLFSIQDRLKLFGFEKFKVPPLLCRHPPPATGRDDDVEKIREILDDTLVKAGYDTDKSKRANRILCGPDNKIGKCLIQLIKRNEKYRAFLPEFPLLHLRKSKINILFSAYKDAGIVELLQFMRNDEHSEWAQLLSIQHIDTATKHIRRIAMAFHLAFLIAFTQYIDKNDLQELLSDLEIDDSVETSTKWAKRFSDYLEYGSERNATFALHVDMMRHCDDIISIALAERLGGATGYNLLLAAVKSSLIFSFVNGATSYAPYCVQLLYSHFTAGHFHQCMKKSLYSTPFKSSNRNFACDTKREMDHLDVVKGFRSGSNIDAVTCRMSLIDSLNETRHNRLTKQFDDDDRLGMDISEVDLNHVYPAASLILRRGALSLETSTTPFNMYSKVPLLLPPSILDSASDDVGRFLLNRYLQKEKLIHIELSNSKSLINGPKELVNRARRSKGVTIKRIQKSKVISAKTERQAKEERRQKEVVKESKLIDAFSSENNACQALLKPDSSKPKVSKALSIQRALKNLVNNCAATQPLDQFMSLNLSYVPKSVTQSVKVLTIEFAGIKFKVGNIISGKEYINTVERYLNGLLKEPNVNTVVVCEEKYSFTPDEFKAGTRHQRRSKTDKNVSHLKTSEYILSDSVFDKDIITKTDVGKQLISTYLAKNIGNLNITRDVELIVDSEFILKKDCLCQESCECPAGYSIPIMCQFRTGRGDHSVVELDTVKQSKGEAEMSVMDWLIDLQSKLQIGDTAACYVSSADIDAVYIHLYGISKFWLRNADGSFQNDMYVVLQKAGGKVDVYNITAMLALFENTYKDSEIGIKIAFTLCLGGNDFIPKLFSVSHDTVLKYMIDNTKFRINLYRKEHGKYLLDKSTFIEFIKYIYTPKRLRTENVTFDDIRAISIGKKEDKAQKGGYKTSNQKKWLPPQSIIERLCDLVQLQIDYMETVGNHTSTLPNFVGSGILKRNSSGEIEYDFGTDAHFESLGDLPEVRHTRRQTKRLLDDTPQHGARRKIPLITSTPRSK